MFLQNLTALQTRLAAPPLGVRIQSQAHVASSHESPLATNENPRLHVQRARTRLVSDKPRSGRDRVSLVGHPSPVGHVMPAAETQRHRLLTALQTHVVLRIPDFQTPRSPDTRVVRVAEPLGVSLLPAALGLAGHIPNASHCRITQIASPIAVCRNSSLGSSTPSQLVNSSLLYGSGKEIPAAFA